MFQLKIVIFSNKIKLFSYNTIMYLGEYLLNDFPAL